MTYPTNPESSIHPQASVEAPAGNGLPVTTKNSMNEKSNANNIRSTLSVRLPNRFDPNSLSSAVAVHENATPIDMSSPMNDILFHYIFQRRPEANLVRIVSVTVTIRLIMGQVSICRVRNHSNLILLMNSVNLVSVMVFKESFAPCVFAISA